MEFDVHVGDYFDDSDIKRIVEDCIKTVALKKLQDDKNIQRLISNSAYNIIYQMVDEVFDMKLEELLKEKVVDIIKNLSQFSIFKKPDAWDRESNSAYKFFQKCIEDEFPKIKEIVKEQVDPQTLNMLKSNIDEFIVEAVKQIYKGE